MMKLFTFTGIPAVEVPAKLAEPFDDPRAYKGVPGGADLTDICTGHMIERITQVFGPKGIGWNFLWSAGDMEILNPLERRVLARLKYAVFSYFLFDETGAPFPFEIQTSGSNANELVYAEEGARTSALGAAVKGLCFQLPVYKGHLDHHSAGGKPAGNGSKPGPNGHHLVPSAAVQRLVEPPTLPSHPEPSSDFQGAVDGIEGYILKTGTQSKGKKLNEVGLRTLGWFASTMKPATADQIADQEAAMLYLAARFAPLTEEEASVQQQAFARIAQLDPATTAGKAARSLAGQRQLA